MLVSTRRLPLPIALLLALVFAAPAMADFITFESGQVRPLALSPDGSGCSPSTRPTTASRSSTSTAGGLTHARLGPGRPGAGGRGGAHDDRGVGRQPPLRQRQHRRRRGGPAARGAHAARRRRAARHRVRRPGRQPRLHHHRAPRPAAHRSVARGVPGAGDPQLTTPGVGRADVWVFDATQSRRDARRRAAHASSRCSATRRARSP